MRTSARTFGALALVFILRAHGARAQEQEPPPFRRGQWGVDVGFGSYFAGVGALRFSSATRAWVLDLNARYTWSGDRSRDSTAIFRRGEISSGVTLRFGRRSYRRIGGSVYRTLTGGLQGRFDYHASSGPVRPRTTTAGAGVYGEIGGQWMVTPHLSLGASWGASIMYTTRHGAYGSNSQNLNFVDLNMGIVGIRGAFYF
jgi:hypothetical protein